MTLDDILNMVADGTMPPSEAKAWIELDKELATSAATIAVCDRLKFVIGAP